MTVSIPFLELLFDTTILPEMKGLEGSDFSTVTLSRPKSNLNNCCACPAPDKESIDSTGNTTEKLMKERDGKELQETQTDNEIETTTPLLKGVTDSTTTANSSEEESGNGDDDDDLTGRKNN